MAAAFLIELKNMDMDLGNPYEYVSIIDTLNITDLQMNNTFAKY